MNIRDLPPGRHIAVRFPDGRTAYIPHDDPSYKAARRRLDGKAKPGDETTLVTWLDTKESRPWVQAHLWLPNTSSVRPAVLNIPSNRCGSFLVRDLGTTPLHEVGD